MCLMFWTHDPDGTQIEVMEMPPESLQARADRRFAAGVERLDQEAPNDRSTAE